VLFAFMLYGLCMFCVVCVVFCGLCVFCVFCVGCVLCLLSICVYACALMKGDTVLRRIQKLASTELNNKMGGE
jgi:hypothetical protein